MNTHVDVDITAHIAEEVTRAYCRMRRGSAKELAPYGLTFAQGRALRLLGRAGVPLRIGDLAERLTVVPRSATSLVDVLENAGLAQRRPDSDDRRSVRVTLTPAGLALLARMHAARRATAQALFGRLDSEQLEQLSALLDILNAPEAPDDGEAS